MASGFSALTPSMVIGRRREVRNMEPVPHNLSLVLAGAGDTWILASQS